MNDRIIDFLECSKYAFKQTFSKIKKSYILFIFILIQSIFEAGKSKGFLASGSYFDSLISYLIDVVIYCFIDQSLRSIVIYSNSGKKSVDNSISNFFYLSLSAMFSVYLVELFLRLLSRFVPVEISFVLLIAARFLLSAVLEYVYIRQYYGIDIVAQSAKFVVNNIFIWGVYAIVFVIIQSYFQDSLSVYSSSFVLEAIKVLILTLCQVLFMLIKGHLFKFLCEHSYRQRKFMRS